MLKQKSGVIIHISSIQRTLPLHEATLAYAAAKAALTLLGSREWLTIRKMNSRADKFIPVQYVDRINAWIQNTAPMYKKKTPIELNCGLDLVKEVLYGKWKIHLIYFISQGGKASR